MPDQNSLEFWKSCASTYKNHPAVIFDLYNEPHDVSWDIWLNGGQVAEKAFGRNPAKSFQAVGMQATTRHSTCDGREKLIIAGGLDWAYDMKGFLDGKQLADPTGNGVIYANHAYPFKGDTVERWICQDGGGIEGRSRSLSANSARIREVRRDERPDGRRVGAPSAASPGRPRVELDRLGPASRGGSPPDLRLEIHPDPRLRSVGQAGTCSARFASKPNAPPSHALARTRHL